jgi:hypothetical protein
MMPLGTTDVLCFGGVFRNNCVLAASLTTMVFFDVGRNSYIYIYL